MATGNLNLLEWLRTCCAAYRFDVTAVFRRRGQHPWPLVAADERELELRLAEGGHLLPLPKEPAALANVLEVSIVDFVLQRLGEVPGAQAQRGTERGYPDIEVGGSAFGGGYHAVDVKIARRAASGRSTESRITLYTGNSYFRYPTLRFPGTFRPFQNYTSHLDIVGVYTFTPDSPARVEELELVVHPAWRIASHKRSSTTREYIGAVTAIEDLRGGKGEFQTAEEFYKFWRAYPFRITTQVQQQLDRLLASQQ
jgi:Restriction endonuclease EcoRV